MRVKTLAPIVLFVVSTLTSDALAQQSGKPVPPSPAWNDNSLLTVQKTGGDPTRAGDVKIEFYGHDAFKITSPVGLTVLTDPWRNDSTGVYPKWFLNEFPTIRVGIVLSTHAHFDHDAVERPKGLMVLERFVGQFKALIPSHYFLDGLTTDVSGLESADGWVNDQEKVHHADVRRLNTADLTLNAAELKGSRHRVYYFGNHFEKK
jgi:hypothetical protein